MLKKPETSDLHTKTRCKNPTFRQTKGNNQPSVKFIKHEETTNVNFLAWEHKLAIVK